MSDPDSRNEPAQGRGDYPRRVQEGTRRLMQELIGEAEKARALAATLRSEKRLLEDELLAAREELDRHKRESLRLEREVAQIESQNQRYSEEFAEIELQHSNLAGLYVASYRLHETLDRVAIFDVIQEIVANLVGSEEMAIFEVDASDSKLELASAFGIERGPYREVPIEAGVIGRTARTGEVWVTKGVKDEELLPHETDLTACIPLKLDGRVTGVIALFRLLPQKPRIEAADQELFDLLAVHAAMALYCTGLHARHGHQV